MTLGFGMRLGCAIGLLCASSVANAQDSAGMPLVIGYAAPPECASADAFRALVGAEVARAPNPDRPWRFSVNVRFDGEFIGTVKTESGSRELRAATCDEVTAALATVIAMATPSLPAPPPIVVADPPPPPPIPPIPSEPPPTETEEHTSNRGLLVAGITTAVLGAAAIPIGLWVIAAAHAAPAPTCLCNMQIIDLPSRNYTAANWTGALLIGGGTTLATTGIIMAVLGGRKHHWLVGGGPLGSYGLSLHAGF